MAIFAVIARTNPEKIRQKIQAIYPSENYEFASNAWFVYDTAIASAVGEKLEISEGKLGAQGVIIVINGYHGWAASDAWDWLRPRWAKDHPGA